MPSPFELPPYPAMSHPLADPAAHVVAARFAGLRVPDPANSKILEIGCASGHLLLPLAMRWPKAQFIGIDPSEQAICQARDLAGEAKLNDRVAFIPQGIEDFEPADGPYDFIIAHGFFSWVEESSRSMLLDFCRENLTKNGIACVSFNVAAGWERRMEIVQKARALQQAGLVTGNEDSLLALQPVYSSAEERAIIDDMLAKGTEVLAHDDFGPINAPFRLDTFVASAAAKGLRWLGESSVNENQPRNWSPADEEARRVAQRQCDPLALHQWMDERSERTFRSTLLCRDDAEATGRVNIDGLSDLWLRCLPEAPEPTTQTGIGIRQLLESQWPSNQQVAGILEMLSAFDRKDLARDICQGIVHRLWTASPHRVEIQEHPPGYPRLDPLRMACARQRLPLVDVDHRPCSFPEEQWELLELLDGTRSEGKLEEVIREKSPRFDFRSWIRHLHKRGLLMKQPTLPKRQGAGGWCE